MEKIKFIVGRHHGGGNYHWRVPNDSFHEAIKIGDYAIVENGVGFTMVEIIATGETSKQCEKLLTKDNDGIKKRALMIVNADGLRELQGDKINS